MKQSRAYPVLSVSRKAQESIRTGHPWIYDTEIAEAQGSYENGDLVDLVGLRGQYLGTGLVNDHSKIRVRLLSTNANDQFDEAFFERRLRWAWEYRRSVMTEQELTCCRIVFGEADFLPGLTVDRFGEYLVTQTLSLGLDRRKEQIFSLLLKILRQDGQQIRGIYERNDVPIRALEGMEQGKGFMVLPGETPPEETSTVITENGIEYRVDFENGQKTGFYLDQKYNRQAVARLSAGRTVLDCFTHTGSFALNAARGGAAHVHAVDVSASAVSLAASNAARNGLEANMSFEAANMFDLLPTLAEQKKGAYDFIILDPPAFSKSRHTRENAARGYKEINLRAMQILPRGGYLATCSCSHFMSERMFCEMLTAAAADAGVSLRQIEARQQCVDHPILWNVPETNYLKFYLFQVV